jgi:hypothetical protein
MKNEKSDNPISGNASEDLDLTQFDEEFARVDVDDEPFSPIPDGRYVVNVEHVELTKAQSSGNPMLKWTFRVVSDSFRGRLLWRNNVLLTQENLRWLKRELKICGVDLDRISDLPANLHRLMNLKLEIAKRTREENENIYINRRVVTPADDDDDDGAPTEDSVPF